MDLDQLIRDADPARGLAIDIPDPGRIAASRGERRSSGIGGLILASAGVDRGVILVPDGVRKVVLDDFRLITPKGEAIPDITTSATVTDNLALLKLGALTISKLHLNPADPGTFSQGSGRLCRTTFAIYALQASAEMTWTEAAGNLLRRRIDLYLYIGTHHPRTGDHTPVTEVPLGQPAPSWGGRDGRVKRRSGPASRPTSLLPL